VTLTDGLLSWPQARQVVAVCGQQLLTPLGLRSLDSRHLAYQGHYGGGPLTRDRAYHQGTVWGWWLGPYALAHARVYGNPERALRLLEAVGHHLGTAGVGSISEIFDGDAPHGPRGCIAQAWSVAEVLRAWVLLRGIAAGDCRRSSAAARQKTSC
jgi:glycogen debranching enzyme